MLKRYLLTPGPTQVPPEVALRMAQPLIHHRTPEFSQLFREVQEGLGWLFQTGQPVLTLSASGSGAMEAAVTNLCSPGDRVVVVNGGKFGERWLNICAATGLDAHEIKVAWGEAVSAAAVADALRREAKAVLMQASETSTTVLHPVREIAALTRASDALLVVDGITAVGATDVRMDEWGIDVLITGSQKAIMLPPGLAFIALSEKAWRAAQTARLPRFYFDLQKERKAHAKHTTAYTPAVSLLTGLHEVLRMLRREGLEGICTRHALLMQATRAAVEAMGLRLLAADHPSPAATGVWLPDQVDGVRLLTYMRDRMGVDIAGGQDHLTGRIVRIAHIGYAGPFDVITAVSSLEMALHRFDVPVELGSGVRAAEAVLLPGWPPAA